MSQVDTSEHVAVTKSASGQWWKMEFRGKVEITDEEPTERQKVMFRKSVIESKQNAGFSGSGRSFTISDMSTKSVVEAIK